MEDICNLITSKPNPDKIEYYHFVYEASIKKLRQPFLHTNYYAHLAFKGNAVLKANGKEYRLIPGTLFFTFPNQTYEIESDNNFTYLYISFNGAGASSLLKGFNINTDNCVFHNFAHLQNFWMSSIRRISQHNSIALTESVLLYTLSYINEIDADHRKKTDKFECIIEYINNNFTDHNISIEKIADIFFYSKKYLSALFVKNTSVKFTDYLNEVRVQHAAKLIKEGSNSISEIAQKCGFNDPFYFSKVFKKVTGHTPTEFIKNSKNNQ